MTFSGDLLALKAWHDSQAQLALPGGIVVDTRGGAGLDGVENHDGTVEGC